MKRIVWGVLLAAMVLSATGCACRPGVIGPYGARPPRCWVW